MLLVTRRFPRGAALAACCAVAACDRPAPEQARGPNVVTVSAGEFAFGMPDTIPAGVTTFRLVNTGQEPHHAVLMQITEPKTTQEVMAAIGQPGPPPAWLRFPPGPNVAVPGDSSNATSVLEPGRYLFVCFISSPDGTMHAMKGMTKEFVVTGVVPAGAELPAADVVITLKDFDFELSQPLTAGSHTIQVVNAGPQLHEVGFEQLAPGKTIEDYRAWATAAEQGPPPTRPVGGLIGPHPGSGMGTFTVTLAPGKYLLTCYVPDGSDGKPHVAHGMLKEIEVT